MRMLYALWLKLTGHELVAANELNGNPHAYGWVVYDRNADTYTVRKMLGDPNHMPS